MLIVICAIVGFILLLVIYGIILTQKALFRYNKSIRIYISNNKDNITKMQYLFLLYLLECNKTIRVIRLISNSYVMLIPSKTHIENDIAIFFNYLQKTKYHFLLSSKVYWKDCKWYKELNDKWLYFIEHNIQDYDNFYELKKLYIDRLEDLNDKLYKGFF